MRLETRSAVSRRVSWLIWSTMASILGLEGAASVEFHLLEDAEARRSCAGARAARADRSWRAQLWAAYRQDMAIMLEDWAGGWLNSRVGSRRVRASEGAS